MFISLMNGDVVSSRRLSMLGKEILENRHLHPRLGHAHADFRDVGISSTIERCYGFPLLGRLIRYLQHVPDGFIQPALVVEPGRGVWPEISPIRKLFRERPGKDAPNEETLADLPPGFLESFPR
ncbi:hypothetical protein [Sorlinia euscelidii]|uniref:Uncharacterized protein n=1 Tax=Sorlinia euscelidii TaxID=3081148 RepID=A0ABU7U3T8_9PROT